MNNILIGNICSLAAMGSDSASAMAKTAKGVLFAQTLSQLFFGVGTFILGGYSAAVQNGISVMRNLLAISKQKQKWIEWSLVVLGVGLGFYFNNLSWLGWLPIVANLEYSLAVFRFKNDEYSLKIAFAINVFVFGIFNFAIKNYVAVLANVVVFVMTVIFLLKGRNGKDERNAAV